MRLVASDLDGTLVRPDMTVSERTVDALAACERAGVQIVFVTGRPTRWMAPVADATGHRGLAVCANGAVVYDLAAEQVVATRAMPAAVVREVVRRLRGVLPQAACALETLTGYRREPAFMPRHEAARLAMVGTVEELLDDGPVVLKVLCRLEPGSDRDAMLADEMIALARPVLDGVAEVVHSNARDSLLEVAAPGVSKASTLADLVAERGIDRADVVAFGDQPNDVPMLVWAGRSWAMADGHPEAIAAADEVAPPCAQDGVAQVLETLLAGTSSGGDDVRTGTGG